MVPPLGMLNLLIQKPWRSSVLAPPAYPLRHGIAGQVGGWAREETDTQGGVEEE